MIKFLKGTSLVDLGQRNVKEVYKWISMKDNKCYLFFIIILFFLVRLNVFHIKSYQKSPTSNIILESD